MSWEERFRHLASQQAGVIGLDQLPTIGCRGDHWWRARRTDRWEAVTRRVLRLLGSPISNEQRVHAALQDAGGGAAVHAGSALAWFGVRGFDLSKIHTVRRRETTNDPSPLSTVHRLRDFEDDDIVVVRGVPTVRAIRAIWSLASAFSAPHEFDWGFRRVGRILDDAHVLGAVSWAELHASVERLGRPGRAGTRLMRSLADRRPVGTSPTESGLEDRFEELIHNHGRRPLMRQSVVGADAPIGRTDFRDVDVPFVVEVNSKMFHSTPSDQHADECRYANLVAAGFTVGVIWDDDLWRDASGVIELVDTARRHARAGEAVVVHSVSCPWPFDESRRLVGRAARRLRG